MFRKQDFKKVDLLGNGKKNTKIYKVLHIASGRYYALKEVEAKSLDKLNEYKEEAVQLFKAQNHKNIIQFYGYFFYETMYNTYRIGIVCEYIEQRQNLEYVFRKRKQANLFWKSDEIEKMLVSLISTLSHMQSVGLCHRDLKPANLFLLPNGEIKVIDFGESKDFFKDGDDGGSAATATIRGTPQYLSPLLWKAHVVDGNSRFAKHNIYKSDVFSVGLLFYQLGAMEDVTGFNQKSQEYDGERLVQVGLNRLKTRGYQDSVCDVLDLMLKFKESDRPSFIELAKVVVQKQLGSFNQGIAISRNDEKTRGRSQAVGGNRRESLQIQAKPQMCNQGPNSPVAILNQQQIDLKPADINLGNQKQSNGADSNIGAPNAKKQPSKPGQIDQNLDSQDGTQNDQDGIRRQSSSNILGLGGKRGLSKGNKQAKSNDFIGVPPGMTNSSPRRNDPGDFEDEEEEDDAHNNFLTQSELFKSYAEQNSLYCNTADYAMWYEYGGRNIGRMSLDIAALHKARQSPQRRSSYANSEEEGNNTKAQNFQFQWRRTGRYRSPFSGHFSQVFITAEEGYYMIGGNGTQYNNLHHNGVTIKVRQNLPQEKTFFAAVHLKGRIYTFGGYDSYDKVQLDQCEYYDIKQDRWYNSPVQRPNGQVEFKLHQARSQGSCCVYEDHLIYIFGGYSRDQGTLATIEKFDIQKKKVFKMDLLIPSPIRRFQSIKISTTKILLIGGLGENSEELDAVFCFDLDKEYTIEQLDKIDRPGIVDSPIILDQIGNLHLFIENNSGTSPHHHVVYSFLEYS